MSTIFVYLDDLKPVLANGILKIELPNTKHNGPVILPEVLKDWEEAGISSTEIDNVIKKMLREIDERLFVLNLSSRIIDRE